MYLEVMLVVIILNKIMVLDLRMAVKLKIIGNAAVYNNQLTSVTIKGKSSSADFERYPFYNPFGWASGYNNSNIIWEGSA